MTVTLDLWLETELYRLEEARQAEEQAVRVNGRVYCWKTTGVWNWLEAGYSIVDVLGLVVLPQGLPDVIELADDVPEETEVSDF